MIKRNEKQFRDNKSYSLKNTIDQVKTVRDNMFKELMIDVFRSKIFKAEEKIWQARNRN